jgi:hypothetical protein
MTEKELIEIVKSKTFEKDGRTKLACTSAHEIGEKYGVDLAKIGKLCNTEKIKIAACKLGCFE